VLVAKIAVLLDGFVNELLEFDEKIVVEANSGDRRLVENGVEDGSGTFALERKKTSGHLVQDDAKREEVSAGVEIFAEDLFRRHVGNGAQGGAGTGELIGVNADGGESIDGTGCTGESFAIGDFGEAEVEDFGMAALGDENVCGFDVAMNDAFGVGSIEGVGNLNGEIEQVFQIDARAGDHVLESLAIEEFHGDEGLAAVFANVVNGADAGMI
jgi:hypothetical protein